MSVAIPGSPVLSDGHAFYTPGLSENRGGSVSYPSFDRLGNLWTQDASGPSQLYYQDTSGFGTPSFSGGGTASPFKFGGGNGCQSDADTGLVLMGHRYMDTRTGRFLTQDPAGAGGNWYAYAGNDPVNKTDPGGLSPSPNPSGAWSANGSTESDAAWATGQSGMLEAQADQFMGAVRLQMATKTLEENMDRDTSWARRLFPNDPYGAAGKDGNPLLDKFVIQLLIKAYALSEKKQVEIGGWIEVGPDGKFHVSSAITGGAHWVNVGPSGKYDVATFHTHPLITSDTGHLYDYEHFSSNDKAVSAFNHGDPSYLATPSSILRYIPGQGVVKIY